MTSLIKRQGLSASCEADRRPASAILILSCSRHQSDSWYELHFGTLVLLFNFLEGDAVKLLLKTFGGCKNILG